jgi:2'-5' RNA ligase
MQGLPLILTLRLNDEAFTFFNNLRQKYFPAERNFLNAHLTLFHHLLPSEESIKEYLQSLAVTQLTITLKVVDVVSIGKGVAYKIESNELLQVHKQLQQRWEQWLIPQDKQKLWPHVTVQNKVRPDIAKETLNLLKPSFVSFNAYGVGLDLWEYNNGPWQHVHTYWFARLQNR